MAPLCTQQWPGRQSKLRERYEAALVDGASLKSTVKRACREVLPPLFDARRTGGECHRAIRDSVPRAIRRFAKHREAIAEAGLLECDGIENPGFQSNY